MLRLCWSQDLLEIRLQELMKALLTRGYRRRSIEASFEKVRQISRMDALKRVEKEKVPMNRVRFVVRYDPRLPNLRDILCKQWNILTEDRRMKKVFPEKPLVCYQRVKNLGEILTRARLPPVRVSRPRR